MDQGAKAIDAVDLFGKLSDPGESLNREDRFEQTFQWPEDIGSGYLYSCQLRPGLILGIGNFQLAEDTAFNFQLQYSPIVMGFSPLGRTSCSVIAKNGDMDCWQYGPGQSFICYRPEWQGVAVHPGGIPISYVGVYIDPLLFNTFIQNQYDHCPAIMPDIVNSRDESIYCQTSSMTSAVNMITHQILRNEF